MSSHPRPVAIPQWHWILIRILRKLKKVLCFIPILVISRLRWGKPSYTYRKIIHLEKIVFKKCHPKFMTFEPQALIEDLYP